MPCTENRLSDPAAEPAPPLYSVWMFDPGQNTLLPILTPTEDVMITDVVAAQPRALPAVILDQVIAPGSAESQLVSEGVGVLSIKSVYDFDGVDTASPNLATVRNPTLTPAANRRARFIRIEKPVSQPDRDVLDIANAAFGVTGYMREILGYAPIEPDGSVKIKVPANVAFQISITDANGRRIFPVHTNWLQLRPGETRECNGCHQPATNANPKSHGRAGLFASTNPGAPAAGQPFPGAAAMLALNMGETMAETRARVTCQADVRCPGMTMSMAPAFTDDWTDVTVRPQDPAIDDRAYSLLLTSAADADCVLHDLERVVPLGHQLRAEHSASVDDGPLRRPGQETARRTSMAWAIRSITSAPSATGKANAAAMAQVPGGQLELTDEPSDQEPLQLRSYRELFFSDNELELVGNALQIRTVPGPPDANGNPTQVPVAVGPYLNAGSANGARSAAFLSRFASGSGNSHASYLSPAELRLLSEWLDIGAQYFNNPFDPAVPVN